MELTDIIRVLRRGAWAIALTTVLGTLAAIAFTLAATPTFQARTNLFVSIQTGATQSATELNQGGSAAQQRVASYIDVATSAKVLRPVIEDLGLADSVSSLAARTTATSKSGSVIISIVVTDTDAARSATTANAIAKSLQTVILDDLERPLPDGSRAVRITNIQPATTPSVPTGPNHTVDVALGFAGGLALGVALVFVRAMADTRIHRTEDITSDSDVPLLGAIGKDPDTEHRPLVVHSSPRSPLAEAYRDLRTNISYLDTDQELRVIAMSSAMQSEGKTTTAANLAVAMAESGARTLIIDADLRRPHLAETFGLEGTVGLSDVLVGRAEPEDVVQPWGIRGLHVLPAGRIPPNPSELLGSGSMRALLDQFRSTYDLVIIDAPPLLPVTDAAVLSKACDGVLVAAAAKRSRRTQLRAALDRLARIDSRVLGIVLTMAPAGRGADFRYGTYGGYYEQNDVREKPEERTAPARRVRTEHRS